MSSYKTCKDYRSRNSHCGCRLNVNESPRVTVEVDSEDDGVINHAPNIDSKAGGIEHRK